MSESPQGRGGRERARKLTPEQRREIASRGASARWNRSPPEGSGGLHATHLGEREVGGVSIPVYNLNNGQRVISERGFLALIGVRGRGISGGHRLARIIGDPLIKLFFSQEVLVAIETPIEFLSLTGTKTLGFDAEILAKFCLGFMKARASGALRSEAQNRYAQYCEILVTAYAIMGIEAWIDEVTGFQSERKRDALHQILERYLAKHWATWAKTFPDEYYEQIFRLRGWKYDPDTMARPGVLGHMTNDIVYSRLAPAVLEALREKNPIIDGRRARKHHQWLTKDYGHPKLRSHIDNVIFMMRGASSWKSFHTSLQRAAPRLNDQGEFEFDDY